MAIVPDLAAWTRRLRLQVAASEIAADLRQARSRAILLSTHVAVRFRAVSETEETRYGIAIYRDGDGDGVLNADIEEGTDPLVVREHFFASPGRRIRYGFPADVVPPDPSGGGALDRLDDPIRFGNSDLASFGELGTATSGTVYLTDGYFLYAVRVFNRTGKIEILRYSREDDSWYAD